MRRLERDKGTPNTGRSITLIARVNLDRAGEILGWALARAGKRAGDFHFCFLSFVQEDGLLRPRGAGIDGFAQPGRVYIKGYSGFPNEYEGSLPDESSRITR